MKIESSSSSREVCIIGAGFVGLTVGLAFAENGILTTVVDKDEKIIEQLNSAISHVYEPEIESLISRNLKNGRIHFLTTDEFNNHTSSYENYILAVGTPLRAKGIDVDAICEATELISGKVQNGDLVIVRSTVSIGTSRSLVYESLRQKGKEIYFAVCPERTIEGMALREIHEIPQLVGGITNESALKAADLFSQICKETLQLGSPESAELAKLASNSYRDLDFAFSNDLARIANAAKIDVKEVIHGCNHNYIRSNIKRPGPVGGPCLSKDSWILTESARKFDVEVFTPIAARNSNQLVVPYFVNKCLSESANFELQQVCLLGLSFKGTPPTADFRGSAAQELIPFFQSEYPRILIKGYEGSGFLGVKEIEQKLDIEEAISNSNLVILLTQSKEFEDQEDTLNLCLLPGSIVIDFWGQVNRFKIRSDITFYAWGEN